MDASTAAVKALADAADAAGLKFRDPTRKPKKIKAPKAEKVAAGAGKAKSATDTNTDEDCEDAAKTAFKNGTKTADCSCVDLDAIATAIVNLNDLAVERIACASPSGAFVDGMFD